MKELEIFPHCDSLVIHAPGECEYCDMSPRMQQKRIDEGVNFTGHCDPNLKECPATLRRPLGTINRWYGNVAQPK